MIEDYKENSERILWKGKPNKSVYIKERIFSPLALIALVWLIFDTAFIGITFKSSANSIPIMVMFFAMHLIPVWLYLGRVVFSFVSWNNTEYMVTDKAVYITMGIFTTTCDRKTFQEITNTSVHQGIIDKSHDVGDVFITTGFRTTNKGATVRCGINFIDIEDYMKVYKLINKTGTDIYSDTQYPNDLRPKENHGYRTKYNRDDNGWN